VDVRVMRVKKELLARGRKKCDERRRGKAFFF
jgi:hypothetical protein